MRARAVHFVAPRRVELREVELPDPSEGRILVATEWSGISSGTELLAYRGEVDPDLPLDETLGALAGTFAYPFRYGYSAVGRVVRPAGPFREGQRVFAFHPHQDRFVTDVGDAVAVDDLDPRAATLYPMVETALQVALDAAPRLGETVVVAGLGAVGILVAALLARTGAVILGSEPEPSRRAAAAAAAFGVRAVDPDAAAEVVAAETGGRGADLVVEASGNPKALAAALSLLAHEGTALVCSWYGTKPVTLPLGAAFHRRRLALRSTQVSTLPAALTARWDRRRRAELAWRLCRELPLSALATHAFPFERAAEAYACADRKDDGLIHAALRYQGEADA
ncbi:MAG: Alcohol dehydrogenase zinc-binding domain protein [Actinomycetia bacterium]|nr:Alcohol dehydrogenase zinc-binding domain protein [Actinomycetes bacterium]